MSEHSDKIQAIVSEFDLPGKLRSVSAFKSGHINETFMSSFEQPGGDVVSFIHQWINHHVFKDVPALMQNIARVTKHVAAKIEPGTNERTLQILPTRDGKTFFRDADGDYWRTYVFIDKSESFEVCRDLTQAAAAARTLGTFQSHLADLPAAELAETIPFFHHTPRRFDAFEKVISVDEQRRVEKVRKDIDFALARKSQGGLLIGGLADGTLPLRVTHNDMKLNNVLFDEKSGDGVSIVDLDTVMGGCALYDIGDLVRNVSVPAAEDETDLAKVEMSLEYFDALMKGYSEKMGPALTGPEIDLLPLAPRIMALTLGVRFLTDYLDGDKYFKIHHQKQNLHRARSQFKIVESMERQEDGMRSIVEKYFRNAA